MRLWIELLPVFFWHSAIGGDECDKPFQERVVFFLVALRREIGLKESNAAPNVVEKGFVLLVLLGRRRGRCGDTTAVLDWKLGHGLYIPLFKQAVLPCR